MMSDQPALEPRFQQPEGWRWHEFEHEGRILRFGTVAPKDTIPDAIVIGLQGVNEFCEKYFETAHTLLGRNLSFWMMDWFEQGKSGRTLSDRKKRHSKGFENDIKDLHYFITEYVRPAAVHPDKGRIPLIMLAHSMGASMGMRYLAEYPKTFACAALSAPMLGIYGLRFLPLWLQGHVTALANTFFNSSYVFGTRTVKSLAKMQNMALTDDAARAAIAPELQSRDPELITDGVTYGWLYEAVRSCALTCRPAFLKTVRLPMLIALAGHEFLVINKVAREIAHALPHCRILELPDSKHEILMATDAIRNQFFQAFDDLLTDNKIRLQRTPF